jgi:hypothetical protein
MKTWEDVVEDLIKLLKVMYNDEDELKEKVKKAFGDYTFEDISEIDMTLVYTSIDNDREYNISIKHEEAPAINICFGFTCKDVESSDNVVYEE